VADSYEAGWKGTVLEGAMQVSLTAFYYEYEDLQVVVFDGGASSIENVGEVEAAGVEVSVSALLGDYFDVYFAYSYLDSEATKLQDICGLANPNACEGSPLFWAPEHTAAFALTGNFPLAGGGAITANLESFYESSRGRGWEGLSETEIDPFLDVALRVGYESAGPWGVELYVENLTDEESWDGENNNGGITPSHFFGPKRPRTFGMRFTYEWE
jgi:iron complex outermembrane receptor protein